MLEEKAAAAKRKRRPRYVVRHIGAPLSFVSDVCLLTEGRAALVVALCIYRRTRVCGSRTVTLPTAELAELGVDRRRKREALAKLQKRRTDQGEERARANGPGHPAVAVALKVPLERIQGTAGEDPAPSYYSYLTLLIN